MNDDESMNNNIFTSDDRIVKDISSDISDLLDVSTKTSSIVDNGIYINNISDIFEYLNNVIPLIQKSNISNNNNLLVSLENTRKELLKSKTINANLNNSDLITAPLVAILSDILNQLREDKKLDINIPESNITVSPTPVTVEAPVVNIPAPIVNVPAPIVNIPSSPAPVINIDLDKITKALEEYLKPIIYNTEINPLAVRLSDGDKWIDELKVLSGKIAEQVQYIPNSMFIKGEGGGTITPATEGTLSQLVGNFATQIDDVSTTGLTWEFLIPASQNTTVSFSGYFLKNVAMGTDVCTVSLYLPGNDPADASPDDTITLSNNVSNTWTGSAVQAVSLAAYYTGSVDSFAKVVVNAKSTTASAYLYCADFYNSGDTVTLYDKLAGLTIWSEGEPSPVITQLNLGGIAPAVWAVATSGLTAAGTTGNNMKKVLTTPKFLALK